MATRHDRAELDLLSAEELASIGRRCLQAGATRDANELVGVVHRRAGVEIDEKRLREHLGARLPGAMIPRRLLFVDALPRIVNGKVDLVALRELAAAGSPLDYPVSESDAPERLSKTETWLAGAWADLIQSTTPLRSSSNLLELGGSSIDVLKLSIHIEEVLGFRLSQRELFADTHLGGLAGLIDARCKGHPSLHERIDIAADVFG